MAGVIKPGHFGIHPVLQGCSLGQAADLISESKQ